MGVAAARSEHAPTKGHKMKPTVENLLDAINVLESLIEDYEEYLTELHESGIIDVVVDGKDYLIGRSN